MQEGKVKKRMKAYPVANTAVASAAFGDKLDVFLQATELSSPGQVRELHTSSRRVRATYAAAARLQRERTARAMRRSGVGHLVLRTDKPWLTEFARFALTHRRMAADLRRRRTGVAR